MATPLRFIIPSDLAEGRTVQKRIMDEVEGQHYGDDAVFAIRLALEEALINAIRHGNKLDPTKKVKVEACVTPAECEIIIEDEGPGFDKSLIPDPTAIENLEKPSGRGILLIEAYMSEAQWTKNGRRLRMVRRNQNGAVPGAR